MKLRFVFAAMVLGLALPAGVAPAPAPAMPTRTDPVRQLVALVNWHRSSIGLQPLRWDDRLAAVARGHSRDMLRRGFFGHRNPDGEDPFDRLHEAGIRYRAAGENVAEGQATARQVFDAWMKSRGHRANIERRSFTHHGIGLEGRRWTHVFTGS